MVRDQMCAEEDWKNLGSRIACDYRSWLVFGWVASRYNSRIEEVYAARKLVSTARTSYESRMVIPDPRVCLYSVDTSRARLFYGRVVVLMRAALLVTTAWAAGVKCPRCLSFSRICADAPATVIKSTNAQDSVG